DEEGLHAPGRQDDERIKEPGDAVATQPAARLVVEERQSGKRDQDSERPDERGALPEPHERQRDGYDGRERDQRKDQIGRTGVDGMEEQHLSARAGESDE